MTDFVKRAVASLTKNGIWLIGGTKAKAVHACDSYFSRYDACKGRDSHFSRYDACKWSVEMNELIELICIWIVQMSCENVSRSSLVVM